MPTNYKVTYEITYKDEFPIVADNVDEAMDKAFVYGKTYDSEPKKIILTLEELPDDTELPF